MIILNEREYAENCLKNGDIGENPFFTISILAKYYYHHCGYRKKKIRDLLLDFLGNYYPRYKLNELQWQSTVDKISAGAGKHELFEISGIKITKSEMAVIKDINNAVLERLMFTMLCLAKLNDAKNPNNNGWINYSTKEIFKFARITCKAIERDTNICDLWDMGLLEYPKRNDNLNCRVTFINNNDEEELFVCDFRELGYEYLAYQGKNFIRCAECGILTKVSKNSHKKYCKNCSAYTPLVTKIINCVDCGNEFIVSSKNNRSCRCPECYTTYRREYKSKKEAERYYRNKNIV